MNFVDCFTAVQSNGNTQQTFTGSKSTIETLKKGLQYVHNKYTRTRSVTSFWCFYC